MYYCGWDGGGTKTAVCIVDKNGNIIAEKAFGQLNPNGTKVCNVQATVKAGIDFMASVQGGLADCAGLVIGLAGVSNSGAVAFLENAVRSLGYTGALQIVGDHQAALAGAIDGCGAILVAGTGSVCFAKNEEGICFRCGGYGHIIDDEGSGYAIGRDILVAVTRAYDGRSSQTSLTEAVYERLGISSQGQLVSWLYSPEADKKSVAAIAPLLKEALAKGDGAAQLIANKAAEALAEIAVCAWENAGIQAGELALVGSIVDNFEEIKEQVQAIIRQRLPQVRFVKARGSAQYGAAHLAINI